MTTEVKRSLAGRRVTMIDNYDSFTYNLVQYLQQLGANVTTYRNDQTDVKTLLDAKPDVIISSPGPSIPAKAGILLDLVDACGKACQPLFGVCLGHQAIAQSFGGEIYQIDLPKHGKTSPIHHTGTGVFANLPNPFIATRYHSLAIVKDSLPSEFDITAHTADGEIMGIRHKTLPIEGVQFHPESVLTEHGHQLLAQMTMHPQ